MIQLIRIPIQRCTNGVYLRWWFNGWHYYCFTNGYEVNMRVTEMDTMVTQVFSVISKIERPTKIKAEYYYQITVQGFTAAALEGFAGLLMAEQVQQYDDGVWYTVDISRSGYVLQEEGAPAYGLTFEITRKELANTPAVYQKSQLLYIGDTLADLDDEEIIPINKQVNDIAEMQDRQSDFTAEFKVRKTRAMRALFELSGEAGANTAFPYQLNTAKLVQDGIEIITGGRMKLLRNDDFYYAIAIYSGNINFFKTIEGLKLADLTLDEITWTAYWAQQSHANDWNWLFPLCEPSNDGGLTALTDDGATVELYAGWVWPFVKVKAIWDEILLNSGYRVEGEILTDDTFLKLFMPISTLEVNYLTIAEYLYNVYVRTTRTYALAEQELGWGTAYTFTSVKSYFGDSMWRYGSSYTVKVAGSYKIRATFSSTDNTSMPVHVYVYAGAVLLGELTGGGFTISMYNGRILWTRKYEGAFDLLVDYSIHFRVTYCSGISQFSIQILAIDSPKISYGSTVPLSKHLPDVTQTDFIKMVCNLFGLIPEARPKDKVIKFWNLQKLRENIPQARDWSAYLSESGGEGEFAFGDYAQYNWLKYKESDDVTEGAGTGVVQVDDETLPQNKDVVQLPLSTCDEVVILTDETVSRVGFNEYDAQEDKYIQNTSVDGRLVYISNVADVSPVKVLTLRDQEIGGVGYNVNTPRKASSWQVAFSSLTEYYSPLAKMLNRASLRRDKFNLPAYEVAGFKHDVPIYLSQYKAYFYVNKISNYVVGRLCTIELIKL